MAERYGGKFSPEGSEHTAQAPKAPSFRAAQKRPGGRANLLFLAPLPLVVMAFFRDPAGLAQNLVAFGILMLAAWLTREGLRAQAAFDERKIARRPGIPRKIFGAVLTGAGLAVAGYSGDANLLNPAIFAGLGVVLHFLAFGPDPMRDKGAEGIDAFQSDRVARAVGEAEKHLAAMSDAILRAENRALERRVESFQATVREMCEKLLANTVIESYVIEIV